MTTLVPITATAIVCIEQAKQYLAHAKTVAEVKDFRDKAQAVAAYLKQRDGSLSAQQDAAEIKVRAEKRLGELLRAGEGVKKGRPKKGSTMEPFPPDGLPDGIDKKQSHRYQLLAHPSVNGQFDKYIETARNQSKEITTAAAMRVVKQVIQDKKMATQEVQGGKVEDLAELVKAGKTFGTIYIDPPWRYGNQATRASTDKHYVTMTVDEIAAMPIRELAAKESHLHLWTTNAFLFECPKLLEAWGFEYKGIFVWVKPQMGIGNYWRVSHELLILGVRGGVTFPPSAGLKSWVEAPRGKHSAKPDQIRMMIEKVSPGPRLEMFARENNPGWFAWGNEIQPRLFDKETV